MGEKKKYTVKKVPKKNEKVDVLELDKMCVSSKKKLGDRSSKSFKNLCENISHIDAKFYATDKYLAYNIIPSNKHLVGKAHTYTVEQMNHLLRHYIARFAHKTYCWSRSLSMIYFSVSRC